jgi:hypothetical protein
LSKVDLQNLQSDYGAVGKLNSNFEEIEDAFENTLSRDGSGPNQMEADLDMNNFRIRNIADATEAGDLVNLGQLQEITFNVGNDKQDKSVAGGGLLGRLLTSVGEMSILSWSTITSYILPYLPANLKGDPGGNAMSVGLFISIPGLSIPIGTDLIRTSGHHIKGIGAGAEYVRVDADPGLPGAWQTQDINGVWWKLNPPGYLLIEWFGAVRDVPPPFGLDYEGSSYTASFPMPDVYTDLLPCLKDAWGGLKQAPREAGQSGSPLTPIILNTTDQNFVYGCSGTIIPPYAVHLKGTGTGAASPYLGTVIRFPPNVPGVRLNWRGHQFKDGNAVDKDSGYDASGTLIEGIYFFGGAGNNDNAHALHCTTVSFVNHCVFEAFAGNGGYTTADTFLPQSDNKFGISSGSRHVGNTFRQIRRNQWWVEGSDTSASSYRDLHLTSGGLAAMVDIGYFNNDYEGLNVHNHASLRRGACYHNGYNWQLISINPNAGKNSEPGTNELHWNAHSPAAGPSFNYPQWSANTDYIMSLPVFVGGSSRIACYIENYYLMGHTYANAMVVGAEQHFTNTSAGINQEPFKGMTRSRFPFGYWKQFPKPDPVLGTYYQSVVGGQGGVAEAAALSSIRQSEAPGADFPWVWFGCPTKNYYRVGFGWNGMGFPDTVRVTSHDNTTINLGRLTPQKYYWIADRFALGGPGGERIIETTAGLPSGTGRALGEHMPNTAPTVGGAGSYVAMGDGTVQPTSIVGAKRATGLSASSTTAEIVAALQAAGLAA